MMKQVIGSGAERRVYPRYAVNLPAEFSELAAFLTKKASYQVCILMDVSFGGARIRSMTRYNSGCKIVLRAKFYAAAGKLDLQGRIVRVVEQSDGWCEYGIAFDGLSEVQKLDLKRELAFIARVKLVS